MIFNNQDMSCLLCLLSVNGHAPLPIANCETKDGIDWASASAPRLKPKANKSTFGPQSVTAVASQLVHW